jgi:hypothetical protein
MTDETAKVDPLMKRLRYADENSPQRISGSQIFGEAADRIEALTAELDRVRDKYEGKDGMDGAVVYAIRRLLNEANVPLAAFIDDHVLNAIIQRNVAEADNARLRGLIDDVVCGRGMFGLSADDDLKWAMQHLGSALNTGKETK